MKREKKNSDLTAGSGGGFVPLGAGGKESEGWRGNKGKRGKRERANAHARISNFESAWEMQIAVPPKPSTRPPLFPGLFLDLS